MGRHSAPDDYGPDDDAAGYPGDGVAGDAGTLTLAGEAGPSTGRHAAGDTPKEERAWVKAAAKQERVGLKAAVKRERAEHKAAGTRERAQHKAAAKRARLERKRARWEKGSRADLHMLRHNTAVRLQCIAVVVLAFAGYTAVMLELGRDMRSYLFWIWIPIVVSGVLVGACLDLAHHRAARSAARSAAVEPASGSVPGPPKP